MPARAERNLAPDGVLSMLESLLNSHPDRDFDAREAVAGLKELGWETTSADPVGLVSNRFSRLRKLGKAQSTGHGRYSAVPKNSDGPGEPGPSAHLAFGQEGGGLHASVDDE